MLDLYEDDDGYNIYNLEDAAEMLEEDIIEPFEEAFMRGYSS